MSIISAICLGLSLLLLLSGGVCWLVYVLQDGGSSWRKAAHRLLRLAMVPLLLLINVALYSHVVKTLL